MGMPAPETEDEWADVLLDMLFRSGADRAVAGARAREVARRDYSYDAWLPAWERAVGLAA
jgi:hypothetical protein